MDSRKIQRTEREFFCQSKAIWSSQCRKMVFLPFITLSFINYVSVYYLFYSSKQSWKHNLWGLREVQVHTEDGRELLLTSCVICLRNFLICKNSVYDTCPFYLTIIMIIKYIQMFPNLLSSIYS